MADFSRLPGPNADLWDWQLLAACRGVDSSLFFHPEGERGAARSARENSAKEVCMRCPVRAECAAHALAVREPYGVWGGLTEDEREELMGRARNRLVSAAAPGSARGEGHVSHHGSHNGTTHAGASHPGAAHSGAGHSGVSHSAHSAHSGVSNN
jgi:WhiB family redox-sensing transcriptional regulator